MVSLKMDILESESSLKSLEDSSSVYVQITLFCENKPAVVETTWFKNVEYFANLIQFVDDMNLREYTIHFLDSPTEVRFIKFKDELMYEIISFRKRYRCTVKSNILKYEVKTEIENMANLLIMKNEKFQNDLFLKKVLSTLEE
ncbi:MAG: hypothetical protein GXO25_06930 [Euryarchaeota archaeon]|nr:hypothetical protein [Euryarchaeota archaeon]